MNFVLAEPTAQNVILMENSCNLLFEDFIFSGVYVIFPLKRRHGGPFYFCGLPPKMWNNLNSLDKVAGASRLAINEIIIREKISFLNTSELIPGRKGRGRISGSIVLADKCAQKKNTQ